MLYFARLEGQSYFFHSFSGGLPHPRRNEAGTRARLIQSVLPAASSFLLGSPGFPFFGSGPWAPQLEHRTASYWVRPAASPQNGHPTPYFRDLPGQGCRTFHASHAVWLARTQEAFDGQSSSRQSLSTKDGLTIGPLAPQPSHSMLKTTRRGSCCRMLCMMPNRHSHHLIQKSSIPAQNGHERTK